MKPFVFLLSLLLMAGCASTPVLRPPAVFSYDSGSRVGIVNLLPKTIKHYHIGTTIFNNFEKEYKVAWDFPGELNREFQDQCIANGYQPVILDSSSLQLSPSDPLTVVEGDVAAVNPKVASLLQDLGEKHDLRLLFVVQPAEGRVYVPNAEIPVTGYGLATRNFLAVGSAKAFSMVDVTAISIRPLALTQGKRMRIIESISGLKLVGNFGEMSENDLAAVKETLSAPLKTFVADLLAKANVVKPGNAEPPSR